MDDLTKEQKHLLMAMYKEVLSRQPALSFEESNYFRDSDEIRELFLPELSSSYVSSLCWALHSKGYLTCYLGDDLANDVSLSDSAIIYMEQRFSNGFKSFVDVFSKLKP